MAGRTKENPFYSNHIFTEFDKQRVTLTRWQLFWLRFLPTYFQIGETCVFYYKHWGRRYYLINTGPRPERAKEAAKHFEI